MAQWDRKIIKPLDLRNDRAIVLMEKDLLHSKYMQLPVSYFCYHLSYYFMIILKQKR